MTCQRTDRSLFCRSDWESKPASLGPFTSSKTGSPSSKTANRTKSPGTKHIALVLGKLLRNRHRTNNPPSSVLNLLQQRRLGRSAASLGCTVGNPDEGTPLRPPLRKLRRAARSAVSGGEKIGHKSADGRVLAPTAGGDVQGSARKDGVFGAARVYTVTVPGPKWKSW